METKQTGYNKLWNWFGIDRASWLTLPRVMMHEMPDDWQMKMAALLEEWNETYINQPDVKTFVSIKDAETNLFIKMPNYLSNYRHPDLLTINSMKEPKHGKI